MMIRLEVAIKGRTSRSSTIVNNSGIQTKMDWCLKPKNVLRKHSPHYYTTTTTASWLDCWHKAGWSNDSCCWSQVLTQPSAASAEIRTHQAKPCSSNLHLSSFSETVSLQPQISFHGWQHWTMKWSSVVKAHLPEGLRVTEAGCFLLLYQTG